eukprot:NODE_43_length_28809_cov_0.237200.p5 type:complete len:688 gc:universal NODE_43_length_28809_cov_0.237200:6665-8728(+)
MKICSSIQELEPFKSKLILCDVPIQMDFIIGARFDLKTRPDWKKSYSQDLKLSFNNEPCVYILHKESSYTVILYVPDGLMRLPSPLKLDLEPENDSSLLLWHGLSRLTSYSVDLPTIPLSDVFDVYTSSVQAALFLYSVDSPDLKLIQNLLLVHKGNFKNDFPNIKLGRNISCQSLVQQTDYACQASPISAEIAIQTNNDLFDHINNLKHAVNVSYAGEIKQQLLKNKAQLQAIQQRLLLKNAMATAMNFIKDLINYREQKVTALEQLLVLRNAEVADLNEKNKMLNKINSNSNFTSKQIVKLTHQLEDDKEEQRIDQDQHWSEFKKLMLLQGNQLKSIFESSFREVTTNNHSQSSEILSNINEQSAMVHKVFTDLNSHLHAIKSNLKSSTEQSEIANKIDQLVRLTRSYEIEKVKYAEALRDMENVQQDRNRLINENDGLIDKLQTTTSDLEHYKQVNTTQVNSIRILETETNKLKKQKKNLELEIENTRNELRIEKEDRDTLEDSNSTQSKRNRQLVEKYRLELEQIKKINNNLEEDKYENNKLVEDLKHQLRSAIKNNEKLNKTKETLQLQDEVDYLELKLKDVEQQRLVLKRQNDDLSDKLMLVEKKSSIKQSTPADVDSAISVNKDSKKKRKTESRPKRERKKPKIYDEMVSSEKIIIPSTERIPLRPMFNVIAANIEDNIR